MKIAILSGKGGTGKTTLAASLAVSVEGSQYIDCDVEEPNGALFLNPKLENAVSVEVPVPRIDDALCDGCGICAKVCQFNALAVIKGKVVIFPEICHQCGACVIACPQKAISEEQRSIGVIESDRKGLFLQGRLNIGEPISVPVIKRLKDMVKPEAPVLLDCAPGASCTAVESIEGSDFCILVTEPTPFGLHDLKIAVALVRKMGLPFGVVINKAMEHDKSIHDYCREEGIKVFMEIPYLREIAENYSKGTVPAQISDEWRSKFIGLYDRIKGGDAS